MSKALRDFNLNNKKTPFSIGRRSVFNLKNNLFNCKRKISNYNNQYNKTESNNNIFGQLSDIEIIKINKNIHNDLKNIQLKKQISRLRKKLKLKYSNQNENNNIIELHPINENLITKKNITKNENYNINKIKKTSIIKNTGNNYMILLMTKK